MKFVLLIIGIFLMGNCNSEKASHPSKINKQNENKSKDRNQKRKADLEGELMKLSIKYAKSQKFAEAAILVKYIIDLPSVHDHQDSKLQKLYNKFRSKARTINEDEFIRKASLELGVDLIDYKSKKRNQTTIFVE